MPFTRVMAVLAIAFAHNGSALHAQPREACCVPPPCKTCVSEPKPSTCTVYACKDQEYCLPKCCVLSMLHCRCDCHDGPCGELRVRRRLVVKKVPGPERTQCVPREVPVVCAQPCAALPVVAAPVGALPVIPQLPTAAPNTTPWIPGAPRK